VLTVETVAFKGRQIQSDIQNRWSSMADRIYLNCDWT